MNLPALLRLRNAFFVGVFLLLETATFAQAFLNGSFEITSASLGCNYNLPNATFNSLMSNVVAYGAGNEVDISTTGCYAPSVPNGNRFISIASTGSTRDEVTMQLSSSLTAGTSYTFTFWHRGDVNFRPLGPIEIGVSTSSTSFGTLIYTSPSPTTAWVQRSVSFIAPVSGAFISLRNPNSVSGHWNFVDDFRFPTALANPNILFNLSCEDGSAHIRLKRTSEEKAEVYSVEKMIPGSTEYVEMVQLTELDEEWQHFVDPMTIPGVYYYRLAYVDSDGSATYSDVNSCTFAGAEALLFPNPAADKVFFADDIAVAEIYDMSGKLVLKTDVPQIGLTIATLAIGMYRVVCFDKQGFVRQTLLTKV